MPKSVRIRDLDDEVYATLSQRAAERGVSVSELLRREITRLTGRPSMRQWLAAIEGSPVPAAPTDVLRLLDEERGVWPAAGTGEPRR